MNQKNELQLAALLEKLQTDRTLPLYASRQQNGTQPVLGSGNPQADIVFVGEAPGKQEAITGKPFSGAAGKLLDSLFEEVSITRSDVYITNLVNDRPPNNRDPLPAEITAYVPYLHALLNIIQPTVLVTLGRVPMKYVLEHFGVQPAAQQSIGEIHGQAFAVSKHPFPKNIIPLYHPAAALYNRSLLPTLQQDMHTVASAAQ